MGGIGITEDEMAKGKQNLSNNSSYTDGQCEESTGHIGREAAEIRENSMCTDQYETIYIDC